MEDREEEEEEEEEEADWPVLKAAWLRGTPEEVGGFSTMSSPEEDAANDKLSSSQSSTRHRWG